MSSSDASSEASSETSLGASAATESEETDSVPEVSLESYVEDPWAAESLST